MRDAGYWVAMIVLGLTSSRACGDEAAVMVRSLEVSRGWFAMEDTGAIWAYDTSPQWVRLNEDLKPEVFSKMETYSKNLLPGHGGVMLITYNGQAKLFQRGKQIAAGSLLEIIEDHRDLLRTAYGTKGQPPNEALDVMIVADARRRIWCLRQRTLWLLDDDGWHDASAALLKAGSRHGDPAYLVGIGDGSRVYITDLHLRHEGGKSFIASFEEGRFAFQECDHVTHGFGERYALRDATGALWLRATDSANRAPALRFSGQWATRLLPDGTQSALTNEGWPLLVDRAGNVWLGEVWGKKGKHFRIWRDGKVVQELELPPYEGRDFLFADGPNSVQVWTPEGLQSLVGEGPTGIPYRLGPLRKIEKIEGRVLKRAYVSGRLACMTYVDAIGRDFYLHVIDTGESN